MLNNIRKAAATPRCSGQKSRSMPTSSGEILKDRSRDLVVAGYAIVQGTLWSRPVAGHCLYLIIVFHLAFLTAHFGFGLYKSVSQSSGQIVPRMLRIFGRIGGSHFGFEFGAFTTKLRQGGFENARSKTTFRSVPRCVRPDLGTILCHSQSSITRQSILERRGCLSSTKVSRARRADEINVRIHGQVLKGATNAAIPCMRHKTTSQFGVLRGGVGFNAIEFCVFGFANLGFFRNYFDFVFLSCCGVAQCVVLVNVVNVDFGLFESSSRSVLLFVMNRANSGFAELSPLEVGIDWRFGIAEDSIRVRVAGEDVGI
mmetsp:Transcript_16193/g.33411  ORF Transcript_16193/g.33411 Transcript_16193/m.33411 type:complete len:314 (+) Transcript_16193:517-1458(+)